MEIHQLMEGDEDEGGGAVKATFASVIAQIVIIRHRLFAGLDHHGSRHGAGNRGDGRGRHRLGGADDAVRRGDRAVRSAHPTIKMLALSFLFVIGVALIAEGLDQPVPKGYIYFAMAFSVCVEMLNLRLRRRAAQPVRLRQRYVEQSVPKPGDPRK